MKISFKALEFPGTTAAITTLTIFIFVAKKDFFRLPKLCYMAYKKHHGVMIHTKNGK